MEKLFDISVVNTLKDGIKKGWWTLKDYSGLLMEWWPIRKQKGGSCTLSVANRIFDKLRSFHIQDRKQALENAITGGWKDLFPIKKSKFVEEPKNNHPASRVFTAERGFE